MKALLIMLLIVAAVFIFMLIIGLYDEENIRNGKG